MTLDDFWFWFSKQMCAEIFQMWNGSVSATGPCQLYWWDWMELLGPGFWLALHMGWMSGGCSSWQWPPHSSCLWVLGGIWPLHFTVFLEIKWWISFVATETETGHILVSCARWLPESARWLLANGKTQDAHRYIMKCAKMNNREEEVKNLTQEVHFHRVCFFSITISSNDIWTRKQMTSLIVFRPSISQTLIDEPKEEKNNGANKNYTFIDIFRTPNIRKLSIYLGLVW